MAFLDGIGKKLANAGQDAAQKARIFADSTKYSGMIADEEKNIQALYPQLGKAYYELHMHDPEPALSEIVAAINDAFARIEQLNDQIAALNGIQKCPRCGAGVPEGGMFCNSCGAKMPPKQAVEQFAGGNVVTCENCGAQLPAGQRFCVYCGVEVKEHQQSQMAEPKICGNCGRELAPDAAFCTGCGSRV